jgi:hypothetical protein
MKSRGEQCRQQTHVTRSSTAAVIASMVGRIELIMLLFMCGMQVVCVISVCRKTLCFNIL